MSIHKLNLAELAAAKAMLDAARIVALEIVEPRTAALFAAYMDSDCANFRAKVDLILREQTAEVES